MDVGNADRVKNKVKPFQRTDSDMAVDTVLKAGR